MLAHASPPLAGSYSSTVRLELVVGGRTLQLAQTAGRWVVLSSAEPVAIGPAQVVLHVDGEPDRWDVEILPHEVGAVKVPIRIIRYAVAER